MPGTGLLGSSDAILGTIILGKVGTPPISKALTDLIRLTDNFILGIAPSVNFEDTLTFTETFIIGKTLTLSFTDKLSLSESNTNLRVDNINIVIPSFIIIQRPTYMTLSSIYGTILIDPPIFGDTENSLNEVNLIKTVTGKKYSYIKTTKRRRLSYEINFRYNRLSEIKNFFNLSILEWLYLTNWKGETWIVKILNDKISYSVLDREYYTIKLDLEGYKTVNGDYRCSE